MNYRESAPSRPDVSVVIVHYQTPDLLLRCLRALAASEQPPPLETFVVDNGSAHFDAEDVRAALGGVQVFRNEENLGFSRASNQGLRLARGRYLLLLNPDAFVAPETLRLMVEFMDARPEVGSATCRLELPDGSLDVACRRLFPTPLRSLFRVTLLSKLLPRHPAIAQYNLTYLDEWQEAEIDQPCGAFMMVRADVVESVGLLSERYFLYCEDTDWAYRIKHAGWRIMYTPVTTVRHMKRQSSRLDPARAIRHFHSGMRIFYEEHYRAQYPLAVTVLVHTAITMREWLQLASVGLRRLGPSRFGVPGNRPTATSPGSER